MELISIRGAHSQRGGGGWSWEGGALCSGGFEDQKKKIFPRAGKIKGARENNGSFSCRKQKKMDFFAVLGGLDKSGGPHRGTFPRRKRGGLREDPPSEHEVGNQNTFKKADSLRAGARGRQRWENQSRMAPEMSRGTGRTYGGRGPKKTKKKTGSVLRGAIFSSPLKQGDFIGTVVGGPIGFSIGGDPWGENLGHFWAPTKRLGGAHGIRVQPHLWKNVFPKGFCAA